MPKKVKRKAQPKPPQPNKRRRSRRRRIVTARTLAGELVTVKSNVDRREARRESLVMRAYGQSDRLVRLHRFYIRGRKGYIVMERIPGQTVNNLIRAKGALPPETAVGITQEILEGLRELHTLGYVHADLHGDNVIVTSLAKRTIKIIDMQLAVRKNVHGRARATRRLRYIPAKLPPETRQWWIDDSYDIYGIGFMMACMLRGRVLVQRVYGRPSPPGLEPLWSIVMKATHPSPRQRYRTTDAMATALRHLGY